MTQTRSSQGKALLGVLAIASLSVPPFVAMSVRARPMMRALVWWSTARQTHRGVCVVALNRTSDMPLERIGEVFED